MKTHQSELQKYASELQTLCDIIIGGKNVPAPFVEVKQKLEEIIAENQRAIDQKIEIISGNRRFRVVEKPNIWTDHKFFYPEERTKWWPFWCRFEDGDGNQVCFRQKQKAWAFIESNFLNL